MHRRRREFELELLEQEDTEDEVTALAFATTLTPTAPDLLATPASVARSAQQGAGNRAVSGVLARDPNPALRKAPTVRPPKPPVREGREVDAIFDASPYLKDLVGAKLRKVSLAQVMVIDEEPEFEVAWLEYAQRSLNPNTGKTFTEEQARAYMKTQGVRAFQDEVGRKVHIRKERADLGTQLHEGLHLFSDDRWKKNMNYHANEGVTEYFTRKIGPEVKVERDDAFFLREFTSATHLVEAAGEQVVAAAYFEGDIGSLERKIDGRKTDGKGTWAKWLAHLEAEEYKLANKLLAP